MLLNDIEAILSCTDVKKRCDILERVAWKDGYTNHLPPESTVISIQKLVKCVSLPSDEYGEIQTGDSSVKLHCRNAYLVCRLVHKIISQEQVTIRANSKSILPFVLTLCAPLLTSINPWSDNDCNQIVNEILERITRDCGFDNIEAAMNQETWIFEDTFEMIRPNLHGEEWKKSTMAEYTFIFLTKCAKGDQLVKFLDKLLPIKLNLIDDIAPRHAKNGIQCIRHLLEEVPPAELRYLGRIDVLHDALSRKLHTQNPELIEELIPCILLSLQCIETEMMHKRGARIPKYDECFDTILTNFHLASDAGVKRALSKSLPLFVSHMGIQIIGHMNMVSIVLEYGLETSDYVTIGYLCKMMVELVNVAWLRMGTYAEKLLGLVVKTLYSIENDHWRTAYVSQKDVGEAINSIIEAIAHLSAVNKELVLETITMMKSEECLGLQNHAYKLQRLLGC